MRKNEVLAKTEGQRIPSFSDKFVPEKTRKRLVHLVAPHVDSYNYFLEIGLPTAISDMLPLDMQLDDGPFIQIRVDSMQIGYPSKPDDLSDGRLTPRECRERGMSYTAPMLLGVTVTVGGHEFVANAKTGEMPIMVMSNKCHLRDLAPRQLVAYREEANETGGYNLNPLLKSFEPRPHTS